ncbi:MAG: DUF4173 domain-containing protein [Rhizobiales bacterium]|nr:DUF4173 domain-containing protein [Hyphomicrobiales bacterium]
MLAANRSLPYPLLPRLQSFRAELQLAIAAMLALFGGFAAQDGMPGSIAATVPAALLFVLAVRQNRTGWSLIPSVLAVACLGGCATVLIEPGPINLAMAWTCLAILALNQRGHIFANLANTAGIIATRLISSPVLASMDLVLLKKFRRRKSTGPSLLNWRQAVLPVVAVMVFTVLLMAANPVIDLILSRISWVGFFDIFQTWAPVAAALTFLLAWALLRMKPGQSTTADELDQPAQRWHRAYFSVGAVSVTLLILNVMFLAENTLDFSYIWSGAQLPPGMTYASYVHRGAYALIITALMAGALIILALWPGSRTEASIAVRGLVYFWIIQNVLLVASSVARTLDYVEAYGMTLLRLSGLIWMALVAAGLLLIAARVIGRRSNLWLLNRNIVAAFLVLWFAGFFDFRAIVAQWNVTRALSQIESSPGSVRQPLDLDLEYLRSLGPSAIPALARLIEATEDGYDQLSFIRTELGRSLTRSQSGWRSWTLRGWWLEGAQR